MLLKYYKKYIHYLKSTGVGIVFVGGCCLLYQIRQISEKVRSAVSTNILNLEQLHVQYIYVDDPRFEDLFMFRKGEDLHSSVKEKPQTLSNVIMKGWKSLNRNLMYRLLYMAQNGSKEDREKAVQSMCSLKHLKDWHYRDVAQMLDARTAIALARMENVDERFFMKPPYYHKHYKLHDLIEQLHQLLLNLDKLSQSCHPCLSQFLNKKFKNFQREGLIFDHDLVSVGLAVAPVITWDQDFLQTCVQAVHHHSSLEQHSKDIADAGGLAVLMNVQKMFSNNLNMCILLAKILSNLFLCSEYLDDAFRSGWVGILAKWSKDKDVRLSAPAARALANLDIENNNGEKYSQRIYLLHPFYRVQSQRKVDVIFIHGLLGGVFVTWRQRDRNSSSLGVVGPCPWDPKTDSFSEIIDDYPQEFLKDLSRDLRMRDWKHIGHDYEVVLYDCPESANSKARGPFTCKGDDSCVQEDEESRQCRTQCWPKDWLSKDVPSVRIIGIDYDTNLSMWTPLCPIEGMRSRIKERSDEFVRKLVLAGVGKKPVVWVCHSMGGLLVKEMLVKEWKNGDKHNLCGNSRGVIFYSTPHYGSRIAALTQTTEMLIWPSVEVQELREQSPKLLTLHEKFLKMLEKFPMDVVSFSETKSTLVTALKFQLQFVNPKSADPRVGEFYEIPQDHFSICKPANKQSFLYQKVLSIVKRHVDTSSHRSKTLKEYFAILNKVS